MADLSNRAPRAEIQTEASNAIAVVKRGVDGVARTLVLAARETEVIREHARDLGQYKRPAVSSSGSQYIEKIVRESWDSQRCSSVTQLLLSHPRQNLDHSATTPGAFTARVFDWEVDIGTVPNICRHYV